MRAAWVLAATLVAGAAPAGVFDTGLMEPPVIMMPDGPAKGAVFVFSDLGGWSQSNNDLAQALRDAGAVAVGVDLPRMLAAIAVMPWDCASPFTEIERLSRQVQRATGSDTYRPPLVAGIGAGGAVALILAAEAPADSIGAVLAVDPSGALPSGRFCAAHPPVAGPGGAAYALPDRPLATPVQVVLTRAAPFDLAARPGVTVDLRAVTRPDALSRLVWRNWQPTAAAALPLVELPAKPTRDTLAIVLSGDGGWRDLDKSIAEAFQRDGVPTVGWDALRYFWRLRTPAESARDLGAIIRHYTAAWGVHHVLLVGFSFGADVLPETWMTLDPAARARVVQVSLLSAGRAADWEITVSGWLGGPSAAARPTAPGLATLAPDLLQCLHGHDDPGSVCPDLAAGGAEVIETPGDHHFDGDYPALARRILDGLDRRLAKLPRTLAAQP